MNTIRYDKYPEWFSASFVNTAFLHLVHTGCYTLIAMQLNIQQILLTLRYFRMLSCHKV